MVEIGEETLLCVYSPGVSVGSPMGMFESISLHVHIFEHCTGLGVR